MLDHTVDSNSISNTKYAGFSAKWQVVGAYSFSQPYLRIQPPLQSPSKIRFSSSVNFHLPIPPLLVHKIILTIPNNTPYICLINFAPPYFCVQLSQQSAQKIFLYFQPICQFRLRQETRKLGSLVRTDSILVSHLLPQCMVSDNRAHCLSVWSVITGLTITDSLSLRLRKLVYCRQQSLIKMLAIRMANHPIHVLSYPQRIAQQHTSPGNQLHSLMLIPNLSQFRIPSNQEVTQSPCTLELGHSNNFKDPYTKTKACK